MASPPGPHTIHIIGKAAHAQRHDSACIQERRSSMHDLDETKFGEPLSALGRHLEADGREASISVAVDQGRSGNFGLVQVS
jgi:hypothetical protein